MLNRMRPVALLLAVAVGGTPGCASQSYQITHRELERLVTLAPEARGASVRVEQELSGSEVEQQPAVNAETQIVFFPQIIVTGGSGPRDAHRLGSRPNLGTGQAPTGGGGRGGGSRPSIGSSPKLADDAKATAIAVIALALVAVVVVAAVEGSRFHGDVQLHPMHPVHLFGRDGNYVAMPLAALDPSVVAWADRAFVRRNEGPWRELARAALSREGWTYGVMMGASTIRSADGGQGTGASTSLEIGHFFSQELGLLAFGQLAWRSNTANQTIFDQRYGGQVQFMPLTVGPLSAGLYGGAGFGVRGEDGLPNSGRRSSFTLQGGIQAQLDINTNIALTARAGVVQAYGETIREMLVGLSIY
ncbi:MAG: hypothetical protein KBG15_20645 [Kofleriaceae bacterium]|nr:hypothetical protein [Kofleriaceae bacterium]